MSKQISLLRQIEEEAVDSKSDISSLLRKCLILASRLENVTLKKWIDDELNGYSASCALPQYRIFSCWSVGSFRYAAGFTKHDVIIPIETIPLKFREALCRLSVYESISVLQSRLNNPKMDSLRQPWNDTIVNQLSTKIFSNQTLVSAMKILPNVYIVQILEAIKSRILQFALDLEKHCPHTGDAIGSGKLNNREIEKMVTNNFFTGSGNVALHCGTVSQTNTVNVEKGNWELLQSILRETKIEAEKIDELKSILQKEPPRSKNEWGTRLSTWFGSVCAKAAAGVYSISI